MSDAMRFTPSDVTVKTGQTVKFVISNGGQALHEMVHRHGRRSSRRMPS